MSWWILVVAGLLEVVWAVALSRSEGFTRPVPAAITVVALLASVGLLGVALRDLPLGVAYTAWVGIGAVGTVVVGAVWHGEPVTALRLACLVAIVGGVVGLKVSGP